MMEANLEEDKEHELALAEVRLCIADADADKPQPVVTPPAATSSSHKQEQPKDRRYVLQRVPWWVREVNKHAYAPKFICIGPYHSGGASATGNRLRPVELKQRYANELLRDAGADDQAQCDQLTQTCKQKLREREDDIRKFYGEGTQAMETDDLVEMMFLDGCFIIKHLYNYALGSNPDKELHQSTWAPAQLRTDLCLLENQIPFDVLETLFEDLAPRELRLGDAGKAKKRRTLVNMALWYMLNGWWTLPREEPPTAELQMAADSMPVDHLLHLLHTALCAKHRVAQDQPQLLRRDKDDRRWQGLAAAAAGCQYLLMRVLQCMCLCAWPQNAPAADRAELNEAEAEAEAEPQPEPGNIPSASELKAMGIKIELNEPGEPGAGGPLDVRFRKDCVTATLEIPSLYVQQTTAPLLQNLVAYEQQVGTDGSSYPDDYFTPYAFLMYNLVSTREDISLLRELRILHITFGSDDKIIEYFKNLCMFHRRGTRTGSELGPLNFVLQDLTKCKQHKVYRDWTKIKKYMDSPLNVFLLIISAMVSLSTVLQALVAVRPAHL